MGDGTGHERRGLLVDAAWLGDHEGDPAVLVVDCGSSSPVWAADSGAVLADYRRGHIPGAVALNVHNWIKDPLAPPHVLGGEAFALAMGRLGVSEHTTVVAYDRAAGLCASRLWWALAYYGHPDARVLDGGLDAWMRAGLATTTEPEAGGRAAMVPHPCDRLLCPIAEIQRRLGEPGFRLLDTRTHEEYAGVDGRGNRRAGHIPGAVHLEWKRLLTDDGRAVLRPAPELRCVAEAAGIAPTDEVVTYCQVGVRAAFVAFALTVAGWSNVRVYDASMAEWANRDDTPLAAPPGAREGVHR